MNDAFKSKEVAAAPIRVIQLLYNAGVCHSHSIGEVHSFCAFISLF